MADEQKPHDGRVYNYLCGGDFHTEVDRAYADRTAAIEPMSGPWLKLARKSLQVVAKELTGARKLDVIVDFGSGVPDRDHFHHFVPEGTTVIYSDLDEDTVEYSQTLIQNQPNTYYFHANAGRPEELLLRPEVQNILQGRRNIGFVFWMLSTFVSDEAISHAAQTLYAWSGPESCLVFNALTRNYSRDDPKVPLLVELSKEMGTVQKYRRSPEQCQRLLQPWQPDERGFFDLFALNGIVPGPEWGPQIPGYAAFLNKKS